MFAAKLVDGHKDGMFAWFSLARFETRYQQQHVVWQATIQPAYVVLSYALPSCYTRDTVKVLAQQQDLTSSAMVHILISGRCSILIISVVCSQCIQYPVLQCGVIFIEFVQLSLTKLVSEHVHFDIPKCTCLLLCVSTGDTCFDSTHTLGVVISCDGNLPFGTHTLHMHVWCYVAYLQSYMRILTSLQIPFKKVLSNPRASLLWQTTDADPGILYIIMGARRSTNFG